MGFTIQNSVSALTVFVQGLLSFFSPCVLPLVPVYLSYLSGGAQQTRHRRRKLLVSTVFFVLGISFAFFVLGMGVSALGQFFSGARVWIARIGGVLLIVMGLIQLFGGGFTRELRLPFRLKNTINPFTALLLGFTFSFAWTPCVGPALASVLLMAGSTGSSALGFAYIGLYTLGFVVPFLLVGIFADAMLGLLSHSKKALVWTTRVGAVLLMLIGVLLLLGWTTGDVAGSGSSSPSASSSAPAPSPEPTA
ncbi:cytochrome C biogenesis protein, partial [Anaerofilum sp. An201]